MRVVESVSGPIEYQTTQLATLGVYDEYLSIHKAYSRLLIDDSSQEAVKRALFIQWYCLAEPSFLSGIWDIDPLAELAVCTHLDSLLRDGQMDAELTEMLQYYASWEYGFQCPDFQHLLALQSFVTQWMNGDFGLFSSLRMSDMANRGQMGRYWLSWGG